MNMTQAKNNRYKNGEYNPNHSIQLAKDKAKSIEPSVKQVQYRDDLYKFCVQKGLLRDRFNLYRTKSGIKSNIYALISILKKNGLADEFFGGKEDGK